MNGRGIRYVGSPSGEHMRFRRKQLGITPEDIKEFPTETAKNCIAQPKLVTMRLYLRGRRSGLWINILRKLKIRI